MNIFTVTDPSLIFKLSFIYASVIAILMLLGLIVYINDRTQKANFWFFITTIAVSIWLASKFFSDFNETPDAILIDRLSVSLSAGIPISFLFFSIYYIRATHLSKKALILLCAFPLATFLLAASTPLYIASIHVLDSNYSRVIFEVTKLYIANTIYIAFIVILGMWMIYKKSRTSKEERKQAAYVFVALLSALVVNVANDFYFIISGSDEIGMSHPTFSLIGLLIFGITISYGMLRKGLFDVKAIILRLIGYSFSIFFLSAFFGLLLIGLSSTLLPWIDRTTATIGIVLSILTALIYPYIKEYFDKLTRSYFYTDYYETTSVLQDLNHIFISKVGLQEILNMSTECVASAIKPEKLLIVAQNEFKEIAKAKYGPIGVNQDILANYENEIGVDNKSILIINDPELTAESEHFLKKYRVDVFVKLEINHEIIGYMLLGGKQSGSKYNLKDLDFLSTVGSNLSLAIRSAQQFNEIENFNKTLKQKINKTTSSLRKTNFELSRISNAKDEMISMLSHQLIPQLTATSGFIELQNKSPIKDKELITLSRNSLIRMTHLTRDMLNSTKIQTGVIELEIQPTDLVKLVKSEISNLEYAATRKKIKVNTEHPDVLIVNLDSTKMREAIFNLLDNAIQYSPEKSSIEIFIYNDSLKIIDHGIGVPDAEQKQLSNKFFRASNAKIVRPTGTGIGLFVASKIIKMHGFKLNIKSEFNIGTTVTIVFAESKY